MTTVLSPAVRKVITERFRLKRSREKKQRQLIHSDILVTEELRHKLDGHIHSNQFSNFLRCGEESIYMTCKNCRKVSEFRYQCSLKWCPLCNWKISRRRADVVRVWQKRIKSPMHLVLTQKNFQVITPRKIREHTRNLARIRRHKLMKHVRGGCVSVEVTNESRGWHLHSHWLLDCSFIPIQELSVAWGKLCGQEFGIVHFDKLTEQDYCNEVCKYVCKGSEMVKWPAEEIVQFIHAIKGRRFFFQFGSMFECAASVRAELNREKPQAKVCECGCCEKFFETEQQATTNEARRRHSFEKRTNYLDSAVRPIKLENS